MKWDEFENEWRKRERGRRKEKVIVFGLFALVTVALAAVGWKYLV